MLALSFTKLYKFNVSEILDTKIIASRASEEGERLLDEFKKHLARTNAEHAFVSYAVYLVGQWSQKWDKTGWCDPDPALIELAAFLLFPHFGNTQQRDPDAIQALIDLFEPIRANRTMETMFDTRAESDSALGDIAVHMRLRREGVRGSAYPDQTRGEIENIQGPFEDWFRFKVGIGIRRALELIDAIHEQMTRNEDETRKAVLKTIGAKPASPTVSLDDEQADAEPADLANWKNRFACIFSVAFADNLPVSRDQLNWMPQPPVTGEWAALIKLVGLTSETCSELTEPCLVKSHPIFVLPGDRLLLFDWSCVFDELFAAADRVARSDQLFFNRHYLPNQTRWMEGRVVELLTRVFPTEFVFGGLTYPDPNNPGGETELDAAVNWGSFLILVEAKGCQFREEVAHSDFGRLRTDLEKNIADAFDQAQRASRFIASVPTAVFREKRTKRELRVVGKSLHRVFKVSVTLHHLADLTTQLANLKVLHLFSEGDYPFSVSLADFDIITRFCEGPDVLLHYIQRRLDLQRSGKNIHGDELDIFGLYLDTRLDPAQFWERKPDDGKDFTMLMLTGGSERFDRWKNAERGGRGEAPTIRLKIPDEIRALLQELRGRTDRGARWIAFSLLNLSSNGIQRLDHFLKQFREQPRDAGQMTSAVFVDGGLIVVVTAARIVRVELLRQTLAARLNVEKYRRRASAAVGFAIELNDPFRNFDTALWLENEWEANPKMEKAMKAMGPLQIALAPGEKLPKLEEPCVCGSGKEFQKCCLPFCKH
jgi:hypothetical protein